MAEHSVPTEEETSDVPLPRRRWSRSTAGTDGALMVKSMLDLRLLDSYCLEGQEEQEEERAWAYSDDLIRRQDVEPMIHRKSDELESTVSLLIPSVREDDEVKINQRPDYFLLSLQNLDREDPVLFPDKWEDRISLVGSDFQVKEACPSAPHSRQDKPSPDSGCSLRFSSALSSPERPAAEDTERTEPLSVDGNSSELEMEEDEDKERQENRAGMPQPVPQTPDQEAFLKEHFVTLAELSALGDPNRTCHSSSESLSISSRFLSQNFSGSRTDFPPPMWNSHGGVGEVKPRPLVSEVRPLVDGIQSRTQDSQESSDQQETSKTHQDQSQLPHAHSQSLLQGDGAGTTSQTIPPTKTPSQKKMVQSSVEPRGKQGLVVLSVASHLSSGLKKAQSVHSLLISTGDSLDSQLSSGLSRDAPPERPTTLPSSPRKPLPTAQWTLKVSSSSPRSLLQESATAMQRKSSSPSLTSSGPRSYMSPTASSMAKMSRSVSVGDNLHISEPAEDVAMASSSAASQLKETASCLPLVAVVHSNASLPPPQHAAIVPVVASSSSSLPLSAGSNGNRADSSSWILQARITGSSRPLPDKISLGSFFPSAKPAGFASSEPSPLVSVCPVGLPQQEDTLTRSGTSGDAIDDPDQPVSLETCKALTSELQRCFKRATHLYRKISGSSADDSSPSQYQISLLLSEAFQAMRVELDTLPLGSPSMQALEGGLGGVGEVKTAALLEEYSLLLLQAVNRKINTST